MGMAIPVGAPCLSHSARWHSGSPEAAAIASTDHGGKAFGEFRGRMLGAQFFALAGIFGVADRFAPGGLGGFVGLQELCVSLLFLLARLSQRGTGSVR